MQAIIKRLFDLGAASIGLLLLSPLLVLIGLAVRWSSRGGVIFSQERIGRGFRPFCIYKFRTMVPGPYGDGPLITRDGDPRIMPLGRFLRATKLDELPQLINVLKGDMSLVGPRPEVARYVTHFRSDYETILTVRPGITDLASLAYRDEAALLAAADDWEECYLEEILPHKIALAKEYVGRASLWLDLKIIARTLVALVR